MNDPDTNDTPKTTAKVVRASLIFRASKELRVSLNTSVAQVFHGVKNLISGGVSEFLNDLSIG